MHFVALLERKGVFTDCLFGCFSHFIMILQSAFPTHLNVFERDVEQLNHYKKSSIEDSIASKRRCALALSLVCLEKRLVCVMFEPNALERVFRAVFKKGNMKRHNSLSLNKPLKVTATFPFSNKGDF